MKKLFVMFGLTVLLASPVFGAEVFVPLTQDNTVETIEEVKVQGTVTAQVDTVTNYRLPDIDDLIADKQATIAVLESEIVVLQALRASVLAQAEKVVLGIPEPEPEPIE